MWGCSQDALVKPIACGAAAKMLDQDFANSLNGIYIDDLYPDSIQAPLAARPGSRAVLGVSTRKPWS